MSFYNTSLKISFSRANFMRICNPFKSSKPLRTSNTKYKLPVRILLDAFIFFRLFCFANARDWATERHSE